MLRKSSLDAKFDIASFGILGYELDLNDLTSIDEKTIAGQIAYYKEHRDLFQMGVWSEVKNFSESHLALWQVQSGDETIIGTFEKLQEPAPEESHLEGLNFKGDALYHFSSRQESISLKKFGHLANLASPVHLKEEGVLQSIVAAKKDMRFSVATIRLSGFIWSEFFSLF